MRSQVIVSWGNAAHHVFDLDEVQPMPQDMARTWLDQQFSDLGCEPLRPTGKVLLADKVLCVAQAAGEGHFTDPAHHVWAQTYARASSAILAKPLVRVDVPSMTVSY